MNINLILTFLKGIALNNNREWFQSHKSDYAKAKIEFENSISQLIPNLSVIDKSLNQLSVKDCTYRFYRDIRFSSDKSPYKRYFGAYICKGGKKSLRGGYYVHIQPNHCILGFGCYWLPTNILTSCRNEIMGNIEAWRKTVESGRFIKTFGYPNEGIWTDETISDKGFGLNKLKSAPKGFPRDYEFLSYLQMKDYCCWIKVDDDFFAPDDWIQKVENYASIAYPMMNFINNVVDDYL